MYEDAFLNAENNEISDEQICDLTFRHGSMNTAGVLLYALTCCKCSFLKKFSYILFSYTHSQVSLISKMDAWISHIYCTYDFIPSYIWLQNIKKKYLYQLKAFVKTLGTFCIKLFLG